jgi:hypothetical protein
MAEIRINATGGVKLYDADDSHYAQIVAGTITSNVDAITLGHDTVTIADNLSLGSDSAVLKFGADGDTTLTHTDGTGLTLNSTNKLCFNDASQYIQGASNAILDIAATDEIELNATLVDINANVEISGTATTTGVHTFSATPVFPDGSLALADLDIDGGTDIGAAIVDADLFIVDDGAGGTNRKVTASRIKTYAGGAVTAINNATENELVTIGSTTTELDAEAKLISDGDGLIIRNSAVGTATAGKADMLVIEGTGADTAGLSILTDNDQYGVIHFGDDGDVDIGKIEYGHSSNYMRFYVNAAEQMRITSAGCMGIGTTGDNTKLKVETTTDGEKVMQMRHGDADNPVGLEIQYYGGAPDGSGDSFHGAQDSSATRFKVLSDGDVQNHDNAYGSISDERIKQDITDSGSQWNDIKAVKVRKYKKKDDVRQYGNDAWVQLGVIAQELEASNMDKLVREHNPDVSDILSDSSFGTLVNDTDNPNADGSFPKKVGEVKAKVKSVQYSILYMKAIKALQEAQTRIETLEAKVAVLEG